MQIKNHMIHNSHKKFFRDPFGAVCAGTRIRLRIAIPLGTKVESVMLRLWHCAEGEKLIRMRKSDANFFYLKYQCEITAPDNGGLLWYYFIIENDQKTYYYGNNKRQLGGEGVVSMMPPPSFQITVYDKNSKTPDWFKETVLYQIFPDRFCRGNLEKALPLGKNDAVYHSNWNDPPMYYKDPDTKEIVAYDFFGGNFAGMQDKLPYLKELGIGAIYLNPIFKAHSNHRYDTGDYHQADPILGTNEEFQQLCKAAKENYGIRILLDGVFSHTGSDSRYFNKDGTYTSIGAYQSPESPYYEWYDFRQYPQEYMSWWGFDTLPNVKEETPSYMDFIIHAPDSVLHHWMKAGISGWRLDVVDELPPVFLRRFYSELKAIDPEAVLIGEVWEDASNKISYGTSREYLCGKELDSAMNYPFRSIVIDFLLGNVDAGDTASRLMSLYENYPKQNFYAMMNLLGSHDVPRILTILGELPYHDGMSASQQAGLRLTEKQYAVGLKRLKMAVLWQMTFPGVPAVYYGDEIGMQGLKDPHNRAAYAWGQEDEEIKAWHRKLIALRKENAAFCQGEWIPLKAENDVYGYVRRIAGGRDVFGNEAVDDTFLVVLNRSVEKRTVEVDVRGICQGKLEDVLDGGPPLRVRSGKVQLNLEPLSGAIYRQAIQARMQRGAGILLHPTSLPSRYGIGDLGRGAYTFVNFLVQAKQKIWQILPLNPVGYGYSPYQSPSAFAGNPMLISLGKLVSEGFLSADEIQPPQGVNGSRIAYEKVWEFKEGCLRKAYKRFKPTVEYMEFCKKQAFWLEDYALFSALKERFEGKPWYTWEPGLVNRELGVLDQYRKELSESIGYYQFLQYVFFKQWLALRAYANQHGVVIVGDMPIFIAHDSADVWANQALFELRKDGTAAKIAGVPPDYFSSTGQLWGNPHYRWDKMKADDYLWWRNRFKVLNEMVNFVRIDHFRGFESYWEVEGGAATAIEGKWVKGPGAHFFTVLEKYFGKLPVIAEDLGIITDEVTDLKDEFALPGMKVLHFELSPNEEGMIGFSCEQNCIVYTGTHDNNTTIGWMKEDLDDTSRAALEEFLDVDLEDSIESCWALIRLAYESNASAAIIPLQDLLCLDGSVRMNRPGTVGENWNWRLYDGKLLSEALADTLAELVTRYNR